MMDKYGQALINKASKLDSVTDACGKITKLATVIVEDNSKAATIALLRKISEAVDNPKHKIEAKKAAQAVNSSLIEFYGYSTIQEICKPRYLFLCVRTMTIFWMKKQKKKFICILSCRHRRKTKILQMVGW